MKGREHHFAPRPDAELRQILDRFLAATDPAPLVARDPVSLLRRYEDPADQVVAGLVASAVAYGRASSTVTIMIGLCQVSGLCLSVPQTS